MWPVDFSHLLIQNADSEVPPQNQLIILSESGRWEEFFLVGVLSDFYITNVLKVWFLEQQHQQPMGACYEGRFSGPILDLLEQKFRGWSPRICVLTSPPVIVTHENLKTATTRTSLGAIMNYQELACEVQAKLKLKQFSLLDITSSRGLTSRRTLLREDGSLF